MSFQIPDFVKELISSGGLPISKMSASSLKTFMKNPRDFYKKYILLQYDTDTSGSMIVGSSVHKALEMYKNFEKNLAEHGDFSEKFFQYFSEEKIAEFLKCWKLSYEDLCDVALLHFIREEKMYRIKSLAKILLENGFEYSVPEFFMDLKNSDIDVILDEIENFASLNLPNFDKNLRYEDDLIAWGEKTPRDVCIEQMKLAIMNFLNYDTHQEYKVLLTEAEHTAVLSDDSDGSDLIPLKGIIDRVDENALGNIEMVDYKVVSKLSDKNAVKWDYELQAGAYFLLLQNLFPERKIQKIKFVEILKNAPRFILPHDPNRRLLQKDLRELCDEYWLGWQKGETNVNLTEKLKFAKVLVEEPNVGEYVIDFDEQPHIAEIFVMCAKSFLVQLAFYSMTDVPMLPNIGDFFSGAESYEDFVNEMTWKNIERDKTKSDDYDGF